MDGAIERWRSLRTLNARAVGPNRDTKLDSVLFEATVLKAVIDFEIEKNKGTEWSVVSGLFQIVADFLLLHDYDVGRHNQLLKTIFERFQDAFLDETSRAALQAESPGEEDPSGTTKHAMERVVQVLKPFCFFAASMWQGLQENENPLTPDDAYWLGAVDEVYGSKLPCLREIAESAVDSPELPPGGAEQNVLLGTIN